MYAHVIRTVNYVSRSMLCWQRLVPSLCVWGLCVYVCICVAAGCESLNASNRSAQYERMYVVCSFVGIHCFEIAHVPNNVILIT